MNHADALREMSVEKYLLGELTGAERNAFEEHLFECSLCADDLKSSVMFAEAVRAELPAMDVQTVRTPEKARGWFDFLLRPQWLVPALAACLLLLAYQSFFRVPALREQLAQAETPHIVADLSLSSGAVRGGTLPQVMAAPGSSFVISADLPPQTGFAEYICSLYAPSGALVWRQAVPAGAVGETISVVVPAAATQAGKNTLLVQGARTATAGAAAARVPVSSGAGLEEIAKHEFELQVAK